ncbi:ankyrin repeat domain-containing protein [Algibacillus agarilyticus]|uniref:ankyrin repeat domain-containing protein n=1 Tax=Algibacillus agarilyticus TaxID=2234133 RepID=UPI000DD040FF|nr:ankyrin repeat domain-containing protein [Algibacillus agarilyticus]
MKKFYIVFIIAILVLVGITYTYTKQDFGYHIHYISQKNTLRADLSEAWLKSCPEITQKSVEPNTAFGIVVAGRKMLRDKFELIMNTLGECGYDINRRDDVGLTPLHAAILYSDMIAVKAVVSLGANTDLLLNGNAAEKYGEISIPRVC